VLGREVGRLVDEPLPAGSHHFPFDGVALAPGASFYRLESGEEMQSGMLIRTK
jgi:hypothetical protein